jgi:hypothetical protein
MLLLAQKIVHTVLKKAIRTFCHLILGQKMDQACAYINAESISWECEFSADRFSRGAHHCVIWLENLFAGCSRERQRKYPHDFHAVCVGLGVNFT